MRGLLTSFRYTIRLLLKSPGFTVTAVLILGFGIGANTAVFSLINTVLLKPLPYPHPERLVAIFMPTQNNDFMGFDYPDFLDISAAQRSFGTLAVCCGDAFDLTGDGKAQRLKVVFASPSLFELTGRPFTMGRHFTENEDRPGGPLVAVLGERFWRSHFNSDPRIIGKSLILSGQSFQIVGVAPVQVDDSGPPPSDLYVPVNVMPIYEYKLQHRDLHVLFCVGRLKDGVSAEQAQADLRVIHNRLVAQYPETDKDYGIRVTPFLDSLIFNYAGTIWLLGTVAGCLLVIATGNIANLLFARGLIRRREIMIRAALGASRRGLVSQLLLETVFLSLLGGIVGVVFAVWAIEGIKAMSPQDLYRFRDVGLDATVLFFVFGVTLFVALLSGILPAWSLSGADIGSVLQDESRRTGTVGPSHQQTQSALIIGQVALACILLFGAALVVRSFEAVQSIPLGFNPHHVLIVEIYPTSTKYTSDLARMHTLFDQILQKVRGLAGVTEAAMNRDLPFNWNYGESDPFFVSNQPDPGPGREPTLDPQEVAPGYFRTLEIPLISGRDFDIADTMDRPNVVIVDESLAQRFFPGQDAVGKQIEVLSEWSGKKTSTIVGVVKKIQHNSPDHQQAPFQAYFPYAQRWVGFEVLVVRTSGNALDLVPAVRNAIASVDPDIPVAGGRLFDDVIAQKFVTRRLASLLVSICSCVAVLLSAFGLYGVLAYSVGQRTREIGVRIALGAEWLKIVQLVTQQGFKLIGIGLIAGIVVALVCARFIEGMLYGVTAIDPISMLIAALVLCLAGSLACLAPALRAVRINPITALRE
jgi:putative ABC transport system permease protein